MTKTFQINPVNGGISGNLNHAFNKTHLHHPSDPVNVENNNLSDRMIPGPPFCFGAMMVFLAILVTAYIPELIQFNSKNSSKPSME